VTDTKTITGLREFAGEYDALLCDAWGVIHNGVELFPGAGEAMEQFRAGGGTIVILTNAPRPSQAEWHIDLDGLKVIGDRVEKLLQDSTGKHTSPFAAALSHQDATTKLEV